ncbi:hypothetical protein PLCT1_02330 [Planctomycetaceae bacterium]|nr:hypothetical protein PLCT1_02330 [Planctomycetaceae bacterium]
MLALEAGDIGGYVMKALVIAFGIMMVLLIIRSMKKNRLNAKSDKPGGPEQKP